jgi:hypothetical protein
MNVKVASLVGAIAVSAAVSYASDAGASWTRVHGSGCFWPKPFGGDSSYWMDYNNDVANISSNSQELMCPAPDNSSVQRNTYTSVNIELTVYGNATSAQLCEAFWNGWGGACTNSLSTTGTGHQTLNMGGLVGTNGVWTSGSEPNFGYVDIWVGGATNNLEDWDTVRGVYYSQ